MALRGVNLVTAMTIVAEIGDMQAGLEALGN